MTAPRSSTPEQLDIPLVWDRDAAAAPEPAAVPSASRLALTPLGGAFRLWLAALADGGVLVLAAGLLWAFVGWRDGGLTAVQVGLIGAAGLEAASVVALGCLWGWRATPGMLLIGVCFSRPIPCAHVLRLWAVWVGSLCLLALPLVLRLHGESLAERLAGGALNYRPIPEGA